MRANETHRSTTDPDAVLYRKGPGIEAKLCFFDHALGGVAASRGHRAWPMVARLQLTGELQAWPMQLSTVGNKGRHRWVLPTRPSRLLFDQPNERLTRDDPSP
jgi:hypothetical protein